MFTDLLHRLRALFHRRAVERELDDELRFHFERQVDAFLAAGSNRGEAERRARLQFGGVDQIKEEYRDTLGVRLLEDVGRDVHYAIRTLRRAPVFAATAIISLALGVGVNTLVFSVVNGLVLRPLPVSDPERVVFVQRTGSSSSHSFPAYRDLRDRNVTFAALAGYRITMMHVDANGSVTHEWGYLATGNYFDLLGIRASAGRLFRPSDDAAPGASPYAVLSYDYWQTRFGGDPAVVGSVIRINQLPYTVVGVAPRGFFGTEIFYRPNIWVPMSMQAQIEVGNPWLENRNTSNTWVIGRLKDGVSIAQAESNLSVIAEQIAREHPSAGRTERITLTQPGLIGDALGGPARAFAFGVLVLGSLVLITACANLTSTLAARGADRHREVALRLAIGAGRGRIVRQLLTEAILLAFAGGAVGIIGAIAAASALSRWQLPIGVPVQFDVQPDARVFAFAFVVCLIAGVAFGLLPARQAAITDPHTSLKARGDTSDRRWPIRDVLVGIQVALCFVLLAACLVSIRGLQHALTMPLGFEPAGVTMAAFDVGLAGHSPQAAEQLRRQALERISALPGVESAAYGNSLPLNIDQSNTRVLPDDRPDLRGVDVPRAIKYQISPGFLRTLGIRLLQGREFAWEDTETSRRVAIINNAFAEQILRTQAPLGRHFRYGTQGPPIEVVGVTETGKYRSLTEPDTPVVFEPILQAYNTTTVLLVRSSIPPANVAAEIQRVISALDPKMPVFNTGPVERMLSLVLLPMRVAATALGAFGLLAIVLAATGIHGLVAYAVARRQREIAIRVAVGASRSTVLRLLLRRMAILITVGAFVGVLLSLAAARVLSRIVYQASGADPITLGVVALIVGTVGMLACWLPARRALDVEPAAALAAE